MYQKIIELLQIQGYAKTDTSQGPCYVKTIGNQKKAVMVTADKNPDGTILTEDDIHYMILGIKRQLGENVPVLILLLSENGKAVFVDWEEQFHELYESISMVLNSVSEKEDSQEHFLQSIKAYKMTAAIAAVNMIVFVLSEIYGADFYEMGACNPYYVLEKHQFYRLITSNYIHFGWSHFFNNMVVFLVLGSQMEKIMGSFRYFVLYFGSGLIGSIASVFYYASTGENVLCAGASGAIFGITGALAALFLFCKKQREQFNGTGVFLMIAGSIYHGFQSMGVDNAAHIGGCIGGFILALVLYVPWQGKSE
ncbi:MULTISPECIES: rhomboid family intramembrane serine protease [Anaerostipes]|uniref:rhomboid family intramembrane serine protease n=1 Tax=Anaerostipes TaxID=207244 RepID=UPI000950FA86|nr:MULTISPECIES: rhomboid family intramembrane serine protease [Anaerostipes]MCI5622197.1 rhomboid family intramembrane serine protease [Anaerostipes sp.]OLR59460.1 rhomboid family intramembrane serine protease [Anaerostipes sp. 494a]